VKSHTLDWEYLADGRPKLQRLPRGARIEYVWDALDRLAKVRFVDPKGVARNVVDTLLYRKTGALDSIRLGNGVGQKFAYDSSRGMLTSEQVVGKAGQIFGNRRDHYDDAARLVDRTRMDGQRVDFGYDALDRLNTVRYGTGNQAGTSNLTYSWDDNGSMTRIVHDYGRTDWTQVGSTGRVATSIGAQDGKSDWGYDWAGRLGYRKWVSALSDTATREMRQYRWNGAEELERFTRLQAASGTTTRTTDQFGFAYGDHGLRVGKYRGAPNGSDTVWTQERRSVWDGPDVVADSTAGDSAWRYRVVLGLNATAEARRDSTGAWRLTYQVNDPVGTPELLLDDSGNVVATYAHDPFGNLEDYQGSRETEFRFGGREWDPDLQAGVFGYRLYDPEMGAFLTHDPMGQFNNPYSYVGADPLSGVDPWGLEDMGPTSQTCYENQDGWWNQTGLQVPKEGSSLPDFSRLAPAFPVEGLRPDPAKIIDILKPGGLMNITPPEEKTAAHLGLFALGRPGLVANAAWYAAEGDYKSAAINIAMIGPVSMLKYGASMMRANAIAASAFSAKDVLTAPEKIWGLTASQVASEFSSAGYSAEIVQSTRGSGLARIIRIKGHPSISQIQVHPGGGRHLGAYYKISTTDQGIIKVVDKLTYAPEVGEKARIIYAR